MASNTFTIEICDEDRRRIDALVDALKKSEGLSKLLEQRDAKLSVVVAHCEHPVVAHDIDDGATCSKCGRDLGWYCHISPKHFCEYTDIHECCVYCGRQKNVSRSVERGLCCRVIAEREAIQKEALQQLADEAQKLDMGYSDESKPNSGWNESRPKCPMCGEGRPMRTLAASWSCGTHVVFYGENGEYVEPSYQTGTECDKTIFRNGFLRCHDLLVTVAARCEDYQRAACVLAGEVERLRAEVEILAVEVTRLQAIEHEQIETQAELAAAKAASVCPVGITDLALCGGGHRIEFYIEDKADGAKMLAWLRDSMKERGEG